MTCLPARLFSSSLALAAVAAALALSLIAPLAAQEQSGTFDLPPSTPTPTPPPAGPADERAGVAIPPRTAPGATPTSVPMPTPIPTIQPLPAQRAAQSPPAPPARGSATPALRAGIEPASRPAPPDMPDPSGSATPPAATTQADPLPFPTSAPGLLPAPPAADTQPDTSGGDTLPLPDWWPYAAGGLGALLLGGAAMRRRRRKPKVLRLAAPGGAGRTAPAGAAAVEPPRIELALEIIAATRSLMMFTLEYRLTIANRSDRAVNDARLALQLACARASVAKAPSAGAAQALADVERIGPNQLRSVTGTVQLPLSAIAPLRQGQTPLFVPLVHVTLEGESLPATPKSFVIGSPAASGRVQPIRLDVPPGTVAGLVAQPIAVPSMPAAA